ncbi:MAG: hypothetical protein H0W72_02790 [Planctomycetes bacterium]|nr:hypothetical protein [Planctomycetota bacterium]
MNLRLQVLDVHKGLRNLVHLLEEVEDEADKLRDSGRAGKIWPFIGLDSSVSTKHLKMLSEGLEQRDGDGILQSINLIAAYSREYSLDVMAWSEIWSIRHKEFDLLVQNVSNLLFRDNLFDRRSELERELNADGV